MTKIALAIPHTPWVPARVESMTRLRSQLGYEPVDASWPLGGPDEYREFTDKEPNWVWSVKLWQWLHDTGAEWCLQLQDDVEVAPCFWPALRAALAALPADAQVVGLSAVHPLSLEIARQGHRWHRTPGMLVGWAYVLRRDFLGRVLAARTAGGGNPPCEDVILGQFAQMSGGVWHPTPTLCDHDTSIPSSYANDHHSHRRPQVTWRGYQEADLVSPEWWAPPQIVPTLPMPAQRECWFCLENPIMGASGKTGAGICGQCLGAILGMTLQGVTMAIPPVGPRGPQGNG